MSSYVLNKYSDLSPPFHLTADGVDMEMDSHRVTPGSIVSRRIFRGFPGTVSVQYLTCWDELEKTSWETKQDLEQYGNVVEHYWAGELKQVGGEKHEISSASCADGKTVASAVSLRGIYAARAQAQLRLKMRPQHVLT